MKYDLEAMARRKTNRRRRTVIFRPIITTKAMADDLARIYLATIDRLIARIPRIVRIYDRTIEQQLRRDSISELGEEMDDLAIILRRLVLELTPELRQWAFKTEEWHRGKWQRAVFDAVSIELGQILGSAEVRETIEAFIRRNVALIANVNDTARGKISDAVFRSFQRRLPATELAKEIREIAGIERRRAIRIAGDQTVKLSAALDAERQRQAGLTEWKWRHSGKVHFREEHKARDGKIYSDETAPEDLPGELPYCGCNRQGVLNL